MTPEDEAEAAHYAAKTRLKRYPGKSACKEIRISRDIEEDYLAGVKAERERQAKGMAEPDAWLYFHDNGERDWVLYESQEGAKTREAYLSPYVWRLVPVKLVRVLL